MSKLAIVLLIAAAAVVCINAAAVPGDAQEISKDQLEILARGVLPPGLGIGGLRPSGDTQGSKLPNGLSRAEFEALIRGVLPPGLGIGN